MEKPDKYFKEIQAKFLSNSNNKIIEALHDIRVNGKPSVLPLMFDLLRTNPTETIQTEIFNILGQLKDKGCIPLIITELGSGASSAFRSELITTCWQSGLDYSAHIKTFVEHFISGDYQTAIECFSVIEEWLDSSTEQVVTDSKNYLLESIDQISTEKKPLYSELIKVFDSRLNGIDFTNLKVDLN
jgi:hypothetical protein